MAAATIGLMRNLGVGSGALIKALKWQSGAEQIVALAKEERTQLVSKIKQVDRCGVGASETAECTAEAT